MTAAALTAATSAENRKAVIAGTIGNVLEWYDFGVYGYFATTISQLFFPGEDKTISLLKAFAVFGVGFVMRPVGSILFGIYGDRYGRRLALSAVIFLMAFSTVAIGLLPTYAQAGVLAPILLVIARLLQGLSAGGEWGVRRLIWWNTPRRGGAASSARGSRSASAPDFCSARSAERCSIRCSRQKPSCHGGGGFRSCSEF